MHIRRIITAVLLTLPLALFGVTASHANQPVTIRSWQSFVLTSSLPQQVTGKTQPWQFNLETTPTSDAETLIHRYIYFTRDVPQFDMEKARAEGASQDLLTVGEYYNAYVVENRDRFSRGIPIWGRYCGPGHSGPGAPVDRLDRACMHHDACYGDPVTPQCTCDQRLINEINRNIKYMHGKQKAMAYAVKAAMYTQKLWCSRT